MAIQISGIDLDILVCGSTYLFAKWTTSVKVYSARYRSFNKRGATSAFSIFCVAVLCVISK